VDPRVLIRIKLKLLIFKREESKGNKKVQVAIETARRRAHKRPQVINEVGRRNDEEMDKTSHYPFLYEITKKSLTN